MRPSMLALALTLGLAPAATAAPITFNFTATQIAAATPGGLASLAAPFATISGSITYDTAVAASSSGPTSATYPTGALTVNQFNVATGVFLGPFGIRVINDSSVAGDRFLLFTGGASSLPPPGLYDSVGFQLADATATTLSSTALPVTLGLFPFLNEVFFQTIEINAGGVVGFGTTGYVLTSLQPAATAVPEPATLLLLGSGLAAAGLQRRMRKRA